MHYCSFQGQKETGKCQTTFGDMQKGALVKTGADFLAECV